MACRYCGRKFNGGKATCQSCAAPWEGSLGHTASEVIRDRDAFFARMPRLVNPPLAIDNVMVGPGSICTVGTLVRDWRPVISMEER